MKSIVSCPECRRDLHVPEEFLGRTVQCPDCKHTFKATPPDAPITVNSVQAQPSPSAAPAAAPPSREGRGAGELVLRAERQRYDDDDDDERDDIRRSRRMNSGAPD